LQADDSPFLVRIVPRDCARDFGARAGRVADAAGECACEAETVEVGGECVHAWQLALGVGAACVALLLAGFVLYARRLVRLAGEPWRVSLRDLRFADPPQLLGTGSFGQVMSAAQCMNH
jgi:hypothetical protein